MPLILAYLIHPVNISSIICFILNELKVWDLFYDADSVRAMLSRKIQEESMRTYLFTYSNVYDSISIVSIIYFLVSYLIGYLYLYFFIIKKNTYPGGWMPYKISRHFKNFLKQQGLQKF